MINKYKMFHYLFGALISSGILYISVSYLKYIKYKPKGYKKVSSKKVNHTKKLNKEIELLRKLFNFETSTLLLGINGIVLKCHGSSSEQSFKKAIIDLIK